MIGFTCWPHLFMKAFSARDERTLRRSVVLYPTFLIFQVPILLMGFAAIGFEPAPANEADVLPHLLLNLDLPGLVVGAFCAGGLAASMSTGDALAHGGASIAVRDGWVTAFARRVSPERERTLVRWMVAVLLAVAYVLTITWGEGIVEILLMAYGPITQIGPALVACLCWKRATAAGVLTGLLSGTALMLWFSRVPDARPFPMHAGLYGLALNAVLLVLVSLCTRSRNPAADAEFLAIAARADGT
jgi:SSS family solute:Na+ symporter